MPPTVLAASTHYARAVLVVLSLEDRRPVLLDRREVPLLGPDLPGAPYHHEALELPLAEAEELVARVQLSVAEHATAALVEAVERHGVSALVLEASPYPVLPASLSEVLASYTLTCAADGMLYRETLASSAAGLGLHVERTLRKADRVRVAADALQLDVDSTQKLLKGFGQAIGTPWRKEHRLLAAAAVPVLLRLLGPGVQSAPARPS